MAFLPSSDFATDKRAIAHRDAAYWFALSIAALGVAAVFSLVLVVGRTP